METIVFFAVCLAIAAALVKALTALSRRTSSDSVSESIAVKPQYKYFRKQFIMTKAENDFYQTLQQAIGSAYIIVPQAHLTLFLDHKVTGQNWKAARSVINRKSVDFLICNRSYYNPLVAIELDDASHNKGDRIQRDELVDAICRDANMPLVRFKWSYQYDSNSILSQLAPYLK